MFTILLFLHFVGLALGIGLPVANMMAMRLATAAVSPEAATALRGLPPRLGPFSSGGLVLLWITGVWMLVTKWGDGSVPPTFWVKFVCVVLLTAVVGAIWVTMLQIRRGDRSVARRMPLLGMAASVLGLLAVLFAVMAFQ